MKTPTWSWQMVVLCAVLATAGIGALKMGQQEAGVALLLGLAAVAGLTNAKPPGGE